MLCFALSPSPPPPRPKAPAGPIPLWEPCPSPFLSSAPLLQLWAFIHDFPPFLSLTQGSSVQQEGSLQDSVPSVYKVSRLVSQEGGLSPPSCHPLLPSWCLSPASGARNGGGGYPWGAQAFARGGGSRDLTLGRAPCLADNVSVCARVCM